MITVSDVFKLCNPTSVVAEKLKEAVEQSERPPIKNAACKVYLAELAGEVHRCRALIFPHVALNIAGKNEKRVIQVSHKDTPEVDQKFHAYIVSIPDKGVADFYFINKYAQGGEPVVYHIKLDPNSKDVCHMRNIELNLYDDYLRTYKDLPWDDTVVMNDVWSLLPKSWPSESPPVSKSEKTPEKKIA
jgi:hypothetical protein